jgi:hypothetical protein
VALLKQELWNQLREADAASPRPRPSRLRRLSAMVLGPDMTGGSRKLKTSPPAL